MSTIMCRHHRTRLMLQKTAAKRMLGFDEDLGFVTLLCFTAVPVRLACTVSAVNMPQRIALFT